MLVSVVDVCSIAELRTLSTKKEPPEGSSFSVYTIIWNSSVRTRYSRRYTVHSAIRPPDIYLICLSGEVEGLDSIFSFKL